MDRRAFIGTLAGGLLAAPLAVEGQQAGKVWRIGYLSPASGHNPGDEAFDRSMKDFGYVEGRNLRMERRYTGGRMDQLAGAAAELVGLNVDVIVVWSPVATAAAKNATSVIPIIFLAGAPIESGVVKSLSRPGGNLTGITLMGAAATIFPKNLEMLKELVPQLSHVAILHIPGDDDGGSSVQPLAQSLGIRLSAIPLRGPEDIAGAFARIEREKPQGLILAPSGLLYSHRRTFIELVAKSRLPAVYGLGELVPEGALMSLSPDLSDIAVRGAFYVDKIFKGAKPADLPVERPNKSALVINLKTAKALGLTIPPSLLQRADQVIE
jgi:putative ABC transport system substrate-binding protein